ncbi:MAG: thiamine diphosphokinase [Bacteroidetes bacterium]|nr:thiamine diphosphokinase [Bacteroidota bacterium]
MSSHHIVREKQEPALVVLGLEEFPGESLGQLLEWSPTIITTQQLAPVLDANGIKIDGIITRGDYKMPQSNIRSISAGKDTFAEAALKYLVTNAYTAVNIITDELQLKDYLFFTGKIDLVIYCRDQRVFAVNSGFSKWKSAGEIIEVLTHPHELHTSGLEPLGNHRFMTIQDGFFSLKFDKPFLFIAEQL